MELQREQDGLLSLELRYQFSSLEDTIYGERVKAKYNALSLMLKMGAPF